MREFDYTPRGAWVVLEPAAHTRLQGEILLPETIQLPTAHAKVVAVGPGAMREDGSRVSMPVEPGQLVGYRNYHCLPFPWYGRRMQFILADFLDVRYGDDQPEPLNDRILLEGDQAQAEQIARGIVLPSFGQGSNNLTGQVLAVGPGRRDARGAYVDLPIEAGDTVRYQKFTGVPFRYRDRLYQLIRPRDLLGLEAAA